MGREIGTGLQEDLNLIITNNYLETCISVSSHCNISCMTTEHSPDRLKLLVSVPKFIGGRKKNKLRNLAVYI